jgi:sec-independent protein translocase protein TatA
MTALRILAFTPFDPWHMLVIGLLALLLFGKRLPDVGRSLGKGISEFKKGLRDVQDELGKEEPEPPPRQKLSAPTDNVSALPEQSSVEHNKVHANSGPPPTE